MDIATVSDIWLTRVLNYAKYEFEETVSVSDYHETFTKVLYYVKYEFKETVSVSDYHETRQSSLVTVEPAYDTVHTADAVSTAKQTLPERFLSEKVRCVDTLSVSITNHERITAYFIFEKALATDTLMWFTISDGVMEGGYVNEKGEGYVYKGRELGEQTSVSDSININSYTQWVRGTKYDGHYSADTLYVIYKLKYDGHTSSTTIYNTVNLKYDGYVSSSVTI